LIGEEKERANARNRGKATSGLVPQERKGEVEARFPDVEKKGRERKLH